METLFDGAKTVAEVKTLWRLQMLQVHPDKHAESEFAHWNKVAQELNEAYHKALKALDGAVTLDAETGKEHTYRYNETTEQAVIDKLYATVAAGMPEEVTIWLVGTWIWVEGTTKEDKSTQNKLKELGYRWHSVRSMWYWRQQYYKSRYSDKSFDTLKWQYGARQYEEEKSTGLSR